MCRWPGSAPGRSARTGFDETFTRYGGEDTEFGWRAQVRGALLVPERDAFGWQQGRWATGREGKEREVALQAEKLARLIAEPGFRPPASGRRFAVPRHVVTLDAKGDAVERMIEAARTLLGDPADDVGLCIEVVPGRGADPVRERLGQELADDPRVRIVPAGGALEAFPASPLHIVFRRGPSPAPAVLARVWAEAAHVRGACTLWRFLRWLGTGARWKLGQGRGWAAAARGDCAARADPPLGAAIAVLGPRARAVFAASSRVGHAPDGPAPDAALADSAEQAAGVRSPVVLLDDAAALAVPAFDPALDNPVGWVRDVEPRAAALGPPVRLPPGACTRRAVTPDDRRALLHCHHLEDVAAFHPDALRRAGTLARVAARGVPVRLADRDPTLAPLLGAELHGLMTRDARDADADAREALSIAMRRAALRSHSLGARARQLCEAAGVQPPPGPRVSVLLATCRPGLLAGAVANVARQRYPRLELVLALHGPGFEAGAVENALRGFAQPVKRLRLDGERTLGAVLDAAAGAADGPLLAKMDDDDLYGPEHLWDLVLAHEYSGAALVGKFASTVYLARCNRTIRQRRVPGETWTRSISGGTMLLARADLERAGGCRPIRRHVDRALIEDVVRAGGTVYRTHDAGYLLVRHGNRHTWQRDDAEFLRGAESVHPGWQPALAGLGNLPPPVPAAGGAAPDRPCGNGEVPSMAPPAGAGPRNGL